MTGSIENMKPVKILLENVEFSYSNRKDAKKIIQNFSLDVYNQEFLTICGASGCGKSTLLNIVAGLLMPTGGSVFLDGNKITHPGQDRTMVFQDDAVFPWYTVRQNIEYGLKIQGIGAEERKNMVSHYLELVGLKDCQNLYPRQLSGGMRKRVDVARALATKPEVLLMDEPFAALDVMTKSKLQDEFLNIWNNERMTVIFITHDLEEAIYLSDRVVVMSANPGMVQKVVDIPFSRPRTSELKTSPDFQTLRRDLGQFLH